MSFVKKIWKDRISQFPNRRTINDGYVTKQVTVGRDEGAVTEEGTPFDATEMNDLENRIYAAIEAGGGGGGGAGTFDYSELFNKPRINNHELNGNKSLGDLGIASNANELPIESGSATNTKDYIDNGLSGKADIIPDGSYNVSGIWSENYYSARSIWVAFPRADLYTITITRSRYVSGTNTMTDITSTTQITNKNALGFQVFTTSNVDNRYGDIQFSANLT